MENDNWLFNNIFTFIEQQQLILTDSTVVVGLSGGPDSVLLLHALAHYRAHHQFTLIAAHLNHEWRTNAELDRQLCYALCNKLDIQFIDEKISTLGFTQKYNGSRENYARHARRYFFEKVTGALANPAHTRIALAHHAQDQQETFFIRLLRGTSLTGLCAIKSLDGLYIRPLLAINKNQILAYLAQENIEYITDPTNMSYEFLRNRIRHSVLPALSATDSRFDKNFYSTLSRLQDTENYLSKIAKKTFEEMSVKDSGRLYLPISTLASLDQVIQYRVLVLWLCQEKVPFSSSQSFFDEIIRFLRQPKSSAHNINTSWSLYKKSGYAYINSLYRDQ
jgi:tRNA(Ile)-lysidine synthase